MSYTLADLSCSVFASLGLPGVEDTLTLGESVGQRECIVLIDGMGLNALREYPEHFPILQELSLIHEMESDFPSTTATNITSFGTGLHPGGHGMLGYTMRVPRSGEPGRLLNALKWDERVDPITWQPNATLFERAANYGIHTSHVAAKRYENSGFTQAALRGAHYRGANLLDDLVSQAVKALEYPKSFLYLYINDLDDASHSDGMGSEKWFLACAKANELIEKLIRSLPAQTRIWVTADHGMINRGEYCVLGKDNNLLTNITLLGGEPRARHLYLKPDSELETIDQWQSYFGEKIVIFSKESAIKEGLFGPTVTADSFERAGDLIAIAQGDLVLIEPEYEKQQIAMVGHHGGITAAEKEIPLLQAIASKS